MKLNFKKLVAFVFAFVLFANLSFAQIGPVVSVSEMQNNLPAQINTFLGKYFPNDAVKSIELKTMEKVYEIDLMSGYDLKFNEAGDLREVDAPKGEFVNMALLKDMLPAKTYEFLVLKKVEGAVKEFSFNPSKGYKVEVGEKDFLFDTEGKHIPCKGEKCDHHK